MKFNEKNYLKKYHDVYNAVKKRLFTSGYDHYVQFGILEGRSDEIDIPYRNTVVLENLKLDGLGLEIGPSHNPIAPKNKGYNVEILDHLSKDDLISKYQMHEGIDTSKIEEVDYVWNGEPISQLIGKNNIYDWIIASHVIEHTPCLVTFLNECSKVLKKDGMLSLVIPHRNYCFDYFNEISSISDILDSYVERRTKPTPGKIYQYLANATKLNNKIAWARDELDKSRSQFNLIHEMSESKKIFYESIADEKYHDVHVWKFIPESFKLIIDDLRHLDLTDLEILNEARPDGCEFYIQLKKTNKQNIFTMQDRLKKLQDISEKR
jgi:predicted SAM-dependent methyltransferase